MNDKPGKRAVAVATLAALEAQAQALRAELAKLRRDLAQVQRELGRNRASELQEANEKLVLAVLQADSIAEAAAGSLSQLAREAPRDALAALPNRALMRERLAALHPGADAGAGDADDLRSANEQLVIAALGAQQAAADAGEAHRQQIRFMAMVAHELRNPLTPIRIAADLLASGSVPAGAAFARLNTIILAQVAHMSRLIDDLLDGARIGTGKLRLDRGEVDMIEVLALAVETCRPMMRGRQQRLLQELPPGPQPLHGDRVRLAQVFSNLLDNASKYTPQAGTITLSMQLRGPVMEIAVADTGIGIGARMLPKIFDMFVQDAHDRALSNGGTGIGLAVVRELVQAHGGSVVASSAGKDRGSRFVVSLLRDVHA